MPDNSSRKEILQRIAAATKGRLACIETNTAWKNQDIYKPVEPDKVTCFKNELEAINGQCILCENSDDQYAKVAAFAHDRKLQSLYCRDKAIAQKLRELGVEVTDDENTFSQMEAGVTGCEFLVARTGSVVVSSASASGRQMNVFPPIHIVLASSPQLVEYPGEALTAMAEKYGRHLPSVISTITGPSRTADIEKTLVLGAHGPKEFIVFLCNE